MDFSLQNNPFLPLFQSYPPHEAGSAEKLVAAAAQNVVQRTQLPPGADFLASLFAVPPITSKTSKSSLYLPQANFLYPPINPLLTSPSWFQQALSSGLQAGVIPLPPRLPREPCLPVYTPQSPNSTSFARKTSKRLPSSHLPFKSKSPPPDRQNFQNQMYTEPLPFSYQPSWQAFLREQVEKTHLTWRTSEMPRPLGSLQLQETGTLVPSLIAGEVIMGFNVWGEKRLCLPHLFRFVLNDVDLKAIDEACTQLQITCTTCSPAQLTLLHSRKILPPAVSSCGLIRKSDAERLIKYIRNRLDASADLSEVASDVSSLSNRQQSDKQNQQQQLSTDRIDSDVDCCTDATNDQDTDRTIEDDVEVNICHITDDSTAVGPSNSDIAEDADIQVEKTESPSSLSTKSHSHSSGPIPVIHECFGRQLGLVHPDLYTLSSAKCIECQTCHRLFAPDQFVGHTHTVTEVENLNHWGFDSTNWRCYLRLYTGRRLPNCKASQCANKSSATEADKELLNVAEVHRRLEQFKIKFAQPIKLPASLSAALRTIGLCASVAPIPPSASLPLIGRGSSVDMPPLLPAAVPPSPGSSSQRSSTSSLGAVPPLPPLPPPPIPTDLASESASRSTGGGVVNNQCHLLLPQLTLRRLWAPNDGRIKVPPPPTPNVKRDWKELPKKLNTGPPLVLYSHRVVSRPNASNYDSDFIPNVCLVPSLAVGKGSSGSTGHGASIHGSTKLSSTFSRRRGRHNWNRRVGEKYLNGHSRTGSSSRSSTDRFHRSRHQHRTAARSGSISGNPRSCSSGSSPHWSPVLRSCSDSSSGRSTSSRMLGNRAESVESVASCMSSVSSTSSSCKSRTSSSTSTVSSSRCSPINHLFPEESSGTSKTPALDHALQLDTNMHELLDQPQVWKRSVKSGSGSILSAPPAEGQRRLRRVVSLPSLLTVHGSTKSSSSLYSRREGCTSNLKQSHTMRRSFSLSHSLLDLRSRMGHATAKRKHDRSSRLSKHHVTKQDHNARQSKHTASQLRYQQDYLARQNRALAAAKAAQGFARQVTPGLWSRHFVNLNKNEPGPPDLPNARPVSKDTWSNSQQTGALMRPYQAHPNSSHEATDNPGTMAANCHSAGNRCVNTPSFATPVLVTNPAKNSLPTAALALEAIWSDLVRHINEYTVAVESKAGVADARQRLFEQFINMQTCYATQIASLMGENQRLVEKLSSFSNLQQSTQASTSTAGERNDQPMSFTETSSNSLSAPQCSADPADRSNKRHFESTVTSSAGGGLPQTRPVDSLYAGASLANEGSKPGDSSACSSQMHSPTKPTLYPHKSRKEPARSPVGRRTLPFNPACPSISEACQTSVDALASPMVISSKPRLYEPKYSNSRYIHNRSFANNPGYDNRGSSECCPSNSDCDNFASAFERIERMRTTAGIDEYLVRQRHDSTEDYRKTNPNAMIPPDVNSTAPDYSHDKSPSTEASQSSLWHSSKDACFSAGTVHNHKPGYSQPWDSRMPRHGQQQQRDETNPCPQRNKRPASHVQTHGAGNRCDDIGGGGETSFRRNNGDGDRFTGGQHDLAPPEHKRRTLMPPGSSSRGSAVAQFSQEFNKPARMSLKPASHKPNH